MPKSALLLLAGAVWIGVAIMLRLSYSWLRTESRDSAVACATIL
ncbi:MAG: hypothetical protein NT140_02940 [Deltaproteobacteria bacterium]|nr:hypothetical protein [Deltaproteobacteria bacterium]